MKPVRAVLVRESRLDGRLIEQLLEREAMVERNQSKPAYTHPLSPAKYARVIARLRQMQAVGASLEVRLAYLAAQHVELKAEDAP